MLSGGSHRTSLHCSLQSYTTRHTYRHSDFCECWACVSCKLCGGLRFDTMTPRECVKRVVTSIHERDRHVVASDPSQRVVSGVSFWLCKVGFRLLRFDERRTRAWSFAAARRGAGPGGWCACIIQGNVDDLQWVLYDCFWSPHDSNNNSSSTGGFIYFLTTWESLCVWILAGKIRQRGSWRDQIRGAVFALKGLISIAFLTLCLICGLHLNCWQASSKCDPCHFYYLHFFLRSPWNKSWYLSKVKQARSWLRSTNLATAWHQKFQIIWAHHMAINRMSTMIDIWRLSTYGRSEAEKTFFTAKCLCLTEGNGEWEMGNALLLENERGHSTAHFWHTSTMRGTSLGCLVGMLKRWEDAWSFLS